jgi:AcrR family transcriptional regulator
MPKILDDEKIYQAVLQVVSERGYAGATTRQMADAAEVSEVTLFRRYENKEQLVKQAILFILTKTDYGSAAKYTGDAHADLLSVVQVYQDTAVKHGLFFFALFAEFSRHPKLVESMDEPMSVFQNIGELIARYQKEGVLKQEHPLHAVATLLAPLMYIATIKNAKLDEGMPGLDLSEHVTSFLSGRYTAKSI